MMPSTDDELLPFVKMFPTADAEDNRSRACSSDGSASLSRSHQASSPADVLRRFKQRAVECIGHAYEYVESSSFRLSLADA